MRLGFQGEGVATYMLHGQTHGPPLEAVWKGVVQATYDKWTSPKGRVDQSLSSKDIQATRETYSNMVVSSRRPYALAGELSLPAMNYLSS